jgi:hypothetical protein
MFVPQFNNIYQKIIELNIRLFLLLSTCVSLAAAIIIWEIAITTTKERSFAKTILNVSQTSAMKENTAWVSVQTSRNPGKNKVVAPLFEHYFLFILYPYIIILYRECVRLFSLFLTNKIQVHCFPSFKKKICSRWSYLRF